MGISRASTAQVLGTAALTLVATVLLAIPARGQESAEDLAKATQNPIADLISVPIQNNINFGSVQTTTPRTS